jgi:hypothetical protein
MCTKSRHLQMTACCKFVIARKLDCVQTHSRTCMSDKSLFSCVFTRSSVPKYQLSMCTRLLHAHHARCQTPCHEAHAHTEHVRPDFGVSHLLENDENDIISKSAGTPAFMAPECCVPGAFHGKLADIWAAGAHVCRCLCPSWCQSMSVLCLSPCPCPCPCLSVCL